MTPPQNLEEVSVERLLAEGWSSAHLGAGQVLWQQGEPADSLALIVEGDLEVRIDGRVVTQVEAGEMLGELTMFDGGGARSAQLRALGPTRLLVLTRETLGQLERDGGSSYQWVLESAIETARRRISAIATRVNGLTGQVPSSLQLAESVEVSSESLQELRERLEHANVLLTRLGGGRGNLEAGNAFGVLRPSEWRVCGPRSEIDVEALPRPLPHFELEPESKELLRTIRENIIGINEAMVTPFGLRRLVYADYTASGRGLRFIEDFIREEVLPRYANTHTEASATGLQTTRFREEARALVAKSVGASPSDAVIFVGSGATGAINRIVDLLALRDVGQARPPQHERPVVFIGPYEHHSNILPWEHSLADLVTVPLDEEGGIDLESLERMLREEYADRPLKIGSFSAASNVTGVATDVDRVSTVLHRYGALAFWDYAGAGPYVEIDMNPEREGIDPSLAYKDAVFLSPHKFVGGPGTPGVLVMKRAVAELGMLDRPVHPGGGTVDFVTSRDMQVQPLYSKEIEHREESGTPAIVESIRCGLVFQLKDRVGAEVIHGRERALVRAAVASWRQNPAIEVLGNPDAERLSITSFLIRYGPQFLHYGFVVALLNDLFGIQARGGCSCAGPYGAMLLRLDEKQGNAFMRCVDDGFNSIKPGWARVNFNYFISQAEFEYIVKAVHLVAARGWALMPYYAMCPRTGLWKHIDAPEPKARTLSSLRFDGKRMRWDSQRHTVLESSLERHLEDAKEVLEAARRSAPRCIEADAASETFESHRWFPLPHEVAAWLRAQNDGGVSARPDEVFAAPIAARV